jgi:hypothetical protein
MENVGSGPFLVKGLFMRPFAAQEDPAEADTVPNLWKGPVEDYWLLTDGSRFGIASKDPGILGAKLWRKEGQHAQHPDVRFMDGEPFTLAPGETFTPSIPMGARILWQPAP